MVTPTAIIRSNRRSLSLTIAKDGSLIVRAPKKLSMDYIYSFIKQKEKWILNKQKVIKDSHELNNALFSGSEYLFCGKSYSKIEINKLKDIELSEENIFFPADLEPHEERVMAIKWYTRMAKEIILSRVIYFSNLMEVDYSSVKIDNSKSKWGSCDTRGNIKFNLRLCMLPYKLIDYVVIHELTHLIEFNHSKAFYSIIESIMPDYKKYRMQLKEYNYVLQLLR